MTLHDELPHLRTTAPTGTGQPDSAGVDNKPPLRSRITAGVAALTCAACCTLPFLVAAGLLTGAGAAVAQYSLLAVSVVLLAGAAAMWYVHRRRSARNATGGAGCGGRSCGC